MQTIIANPLNAPGVSSRTSSVAEQFLACLARREFDAIETILAGNVWFRALLPKSLREVNTAAEAVSAMRGWFEDADDFVVLNMDSEPATNRHRILYRFLLRPEWDPEHQYVIEQVGYVRVRQGVISRIDLVCTGFVSVAEADGALLR